MKSGRVLSGSAAPRLRSRLLRRISPVSKSNNIFMRSQLRARSKNRFATIDIEPTVDDQLTRLEEDIRRLKIEFDVFFNGASKRPPYDTKGRVDTIIKRLGDDRTLSFAQRYRYSSLATRYNAFRDLWRRTMQGREEGRDAIATARVSAKEQAVASFERANFVCDDAHKDVELVKNLYSALV